MSKRRTARVGKKKASRHSTTGSVRPWQIAVLVGVALLVVGILWLKKQSLTPQPAVVVEPALALATPTASAESNPDSGLAAQAVTLEAQSPPLESVSDLALRPGESPEEQLKRLLAAGRPIFAFFHSTTCYQCIQMTGIVEQIYPEFADRVALVDVNVYAEANQSLLRQAGIRVIPTLIFVDHTGTGQSYTGVMPAEQLRATLEGLAGGATP